MLSSSTTADFPRNAEGFITIFPLLDEQSVPDIVVPVSVLHDLVTEELKCPICWGTIERTLTVTTCLHRFCTECLQRSLRVELSGQKTSHECPACRAKMASRRDARPDSRFDQLIERLTTLSQSSEQVENTTTRNNKRKLDSDVLVDIKAMQQLHREKTELLRQKSREIATSGKVWTHTPSAEVVAKKQRQEKEKKESSTIPSGPRVRMALFPFPDWQPDQEMLAVAATNDFLVKPSCRLLLPFLKVPALMQVSNIKQYLCMRMRLDEALAQRLQVILMCAGEPVVLNECFTVSDVFMSFWDQKSEFVLYYRLVPS